MLAVLMIARLGRAQHDAAWHQVTPFFILPFILLAPLNGALCNRFSKRLVLTLTSALCVPAVLAIGLTAGGPWLWCLAVGLIAVGFAIYSPARYALLPAAAVDTGWPLSRLNGLIEMGGSAAVVGGLLLGLNLNGLSLALAGGVMPAAVGLSALLYLAAALAAWPVSFRADVQRIEPVGRALAGFFRDTARVFRDPEARGSLLAQACFLGLVATAAGVLFAYSGGLHDGGARGSLSRDMVLIGLGAALGSLLAGLVGHPRRVLGLVPLGSTGLLAALAWAAFAADATLPCLALGLMTGLVNVPLRATYQAAVPADARGNGMAVLNTVYYSLTSLLAVAMFALARSQVLSLAGQLFVLAGLAALGTLVAWRVLLRESVELFLACLLAVSYRVRARGPGLTEMPARGRLLIVANHSSWCDPAFLALVLPRELTPMMTSVFYDKRLLRWAFRHIFKAIRVERSGYRRDAPEIREAIRILDLDRAVLIFPEAILRRAEAVPLRQFGQGVWHILRERPETPVLVCWIEGGWGSYFSWRHGPPMVNKRLDWRRPIDVAVNEPEVLPADVLASQRATRTYLMQACLEARRHLGLEPLSNAAPVRSVSQPNFKTDASGSI